MEQILHLDVPLVPIYQIQIPIYFSEESTLVFYYKKLKRK
jgi:hypothetical protein